jgi:Ca2+-binding EF-hand superfamily protein
MDQDHSGKISRAEIKKIIEQANITNENIDKIIDECDKNKDGEIDYK